MGLDVGTTSTQLILSRLRVENRASGFTVPDMAITQRQILYKSPVYLTPLLSESRMDAQALKLLVEEEYRKAGVTPEQVDTGAIIVTGETSRKENAAAVLHALSGMAGEFVVAAAGPDLESKLAAKGSGAAAWSRETGKTVLHMDIGGGTSNLALIRAGKIQATGCLNVGGRLVKLEENDRVRYVSPVLEGIFPIRAGQILTENQAEELCVLLTRALEMAAGLRSREPLLEKLLTGEAAGQIPRLEESVTLSFSGGVADCIESRQPWNAFGDIGPVLGRCIRKSGLCKGPYILGKETIRATVIGAGCHSTQLSGSTVFHRNVSFPLKNVPVAKLSGEKSLRDTLAHRDGPVILALGETGPAGYREIRAIAESMAPQLPRPVLLCMEQDMAKALGQALALRLPEDTPILCIDRVRVEEDSYLDIGSPVGTALPVVVKTLVLEKENRRCV